MTNDEKSRKTTGGVHDTPNRKNAKKFKSVTMSNLRRNKKQSWIINLFLWGLYQSAMNVIGSMEFITSLNDRDTDLRVLRLVQLIHAETVTIVDRIRSEGRNEAITIHRVMLTEGYREVDLLYEAKERSLLKNKLRWVFVYNKLDRKNNLGDTWGRNLQLPYKEAIIFGRFFSDLAYQLNRHR